MLPSRTLGKILRGKASAPQIAMAAMLGAMLGFVPGFVLPGDLGGGFLQAPGLILSLVGAVLVLNANLAVFGVCLAVAKLLSLALLPVSFAVGRAVLDGPLAPLLEAAIRAPVLAWFGLEYYATTGGLVMGATFGLACAAVLIFVLRRLRTAMAGLEQGSEQFRRWSQKRFVKLATWLLLGKRKHGKSYSELAENRRMGLPVRLSGVAAVVALGAGLAWAQSFFAGPAFGRALRSGLESWNGATVDLERASLDLAAGRFALTGLAMADPQALERDALSARQIALQIDTGALWARRFVVAELKSASVHTGTPRATKGELVRAPEPPAPPPPEVADEVDVERWLEDAQKWKERLQQANEWLQRLTGGGASGKPGTPDAEAPARDIERQIADYGLARVVATHRITGAPRVLIRTLELEGVVAADLPGEPLDITAKNLASDPRLLDAPLEIAVRARSGRFGFELRYDPKDAGTVQTKLFVRDVQVDELAAHWAKDPPIRGGLLEVGVDGTLALGRGPKGSAMLDLPVRVELRHTELRLPGMQPTEFGKLEVPFGLRGPLASPSLTFDETAFADALVAAGKRELADRFRQRATELLEGRVPGEVGEQLRGVLEGAEPPGAALDAARKQAEEEAQRKAEAELKERLPGLFGGKK